jgi:hypothetical protein
MLMAGHNMANGDDAERSMTAGSTLDTTENLYGKQVEKLWALDEHKAMNGTNWRRPGAPYAPDRLMIRFDGPWEGPSRGA